MLCVTRFLHLLRSYLSMFRNTCPHTGDNQLNKRLFAVISLNVWSVAEILVSRTRDEEIYRVW